MPMVLPPTVAGFFLLLIFSRRRPFGIFYLKILELKLCRHGLDVSLLPGNFISTDVQKCPCSDGTDRCESDLCRKDTRHVRYRNLLESSDPDRRIWNRIGTILTFARALGEYGATSMLAGNIPGKTGTISQKIAMVIQDGDYMTAGVWVAIVMVIAFLVIFLMNLISGKKMKNVKRW